VENKLKNYLKDNKIIIPYLYSLKNQWFFNIINYLYKKECNYVY
jgi:hypothetical protein